MNDRQVLVAKSKRGGDKICIDGFLFVKNKNKDDKFCWNCEKKKIYGCRGTAVTILQGTNHFLESHDATKHCHAAEASRFELSNISHNTKSLATTTNDNPAQIVQTVTADANLAIRSYLPNREAFRKKIKRARQYDHPAEPNSLDDLNLTPEYTVTLRGVDFCKDIRFGQDRILIFVTKENLNKLNEAPYWIMDGTFKTVPRILMQMYTIHAPVGPNNNSRILPLIYALMSSKTLEIYTRLFQEIKDLANLENIDLRPDFVITDFEKSAMNAVVNEFPGVQNKCCHFHLAQSTYRRICDAGLSARYGSNEYFSASLRLLPALAFLSSPEIPAAFLEVKALISNEADVVVTWFEENYVLGRLRNPGRNGIPRRHPPLFPPDQWSVFENNELGFPRSQNNIEAWHRRWSALVGKKHLGLYKFITQIKREQNEVENDFERINNGEPRPNLRKEDMDREKALRTIIADRGNRTTIRFLQGIAHNLKL
jgi:hypothetical protein